MAAVKVSLLALLFGAYIALAFAQQAQTCSAVDKKCNEKTECCSSCCLGTKCVHANQCAPKCGDDVKTKCKVGYECFLKRVTNCTQSPCKPRPACRYIPPCNRLRCRIGTQCVDIGGNPRTAACRPLHKPTITTLSPTPPTTKPTTTTLSPTTKPTTTTLSPTPATTKPTTTTLSPTPTTTKPTTTTLSPIPATTKPTTTTLSPTPTTTKPTTTTLSPTPANTKPTTTTLSPTPTTTNLPLCSVSSSGVD